METLSFGEFLKQKRKEYRMSQKEFSKMIGISINTLVKYERETYIPSVKKQEEIKNILNGSAKVLSTTINIMEGLNAIKWPPPSLYLEQSEDLLDSILNELFTDDEWELLSLYEILNMTGKAKALEYLSDLADNTKYCRPITEG